MYRFNEMCLKIWNIILVAKKMYYTLIYYPYPGSKNEMMKYIIIFVLSQDSNVVFSRSKENKLSFCNTLIIIV